MKFVKFTLFSTYTCTFSIQFSHHFSEQYKIGSKDLPESVFKSNLPFSEAKIRRFLLSQLARYSLYHKNPVEHENLKPRMSNDRSEQADLWLGRFNLQSVGADLMSERTDLV